ADRLRELGTSIGRARVDVDDRDVVARDRFEAMPQPLALIAPDDDDPRRAASNRLHALRSKRNVDTSAAFGHRGLRRIARARAGSARTSLDLEHRFGAPRAPQRKRERRPRQRDHDEDEHGETDARMRTLLREPDDPPADPRARENPSRQAQILEPASQ